MIEWHRIFGLTLADFFYRSVYRVEVEKDLSLKQQYYEIQWATHKIRVIVLSQVPKIKRNAIWQLFSGIAEKVQFGAAQYQWRQPDKSGISNEFYKYYHVEGMNMPYTWDDYYREVTQEHLHWLTAEDRLKGLPAEERLKGLTAEEIEAYLKKLRQKKRKKNKRRSLSTIERLGA